MNTYPCSICGYTPQVLWQNPATEKLYCGQCIPESEVVHEFGYKETDPNGIPVGEPGAKLDAGKVRVGMMLDQFAHALWAVAEVSTYGAGKYSEGGWLEVSDGETRYSDAEGRHLLKKGMGEERDVESGLLHDAHKAWNVLAQLELKLKFIRREKK